MSVDHSQYQADCIDDAVTIARRHGFCLIKGFFTTAEVGQWESAAIALPSTLRASDFLSAGVLDSLIFDERVLTLARALLGPNLVYYGETNFSLGIERPFRQWHFDARGMPGDIMASHDPPPGHIYQGWRFGIYCRDYVHHSGGLKVAPGSHLQHKSWLSTAVTHSSTFVVDSKRIEIGIPDHPIYDVPSTPGDLVLFNLRTFHSAGFRRLRGHPDSHLPPQIEELLYQQAPTLMEPPATPRNALFFDYAAPSVDIDLYIKWRQHKTFKTNADMREAILATELGPYRYDLPERRAVAERHGILLRADRIIAQLVLKRRFLDGLSQYDEDRLSAALASHQEFSPHFPLKDLIAAA